MSKISVIIPVYNVAKDNYLKDCLDSVLAQTFTDYDLILVDDGSTDASGVICDEYAKNDARIKVFHKKNGGQSSARNLGIEWAIKNSDSEWVSFIDGDDTVHPNFLEYLYKVAIESKTKISACRFRFVKNRDEQIKNDTYSERIQSSDDYFINTDIVNVSPCNKLYHKTLLGSIKFIEGRYCEDKIFCYEAVLAVDKVAVIDAVLYKYIYRQGSTMHTQHSIKRIRDNFWILNRMCCDFQVRYKHLFPIVKERAKREYLSIYSEAIKEEGDVSFIKKVKRVFNKNFRKYLRICKIKMKENIGAYELVYPNFMRFYFLVKKIVKKGDGE